MARLKKISLACFGLLVLLSLMSFVKASAQLARTTTTETPDTTPPPLYVNLHPLALSPHDYPHISQYQTRHPKVYCGPSVLAMGWMPHQAPPSPLSLSDYVDSFAELLGTSATQGTNVLEMLAGLEQLPTLKGEPSAKRRVWYEGIYEVPRRYAPHVLSLRRWPHANARVLKALRQGDLVVGHLGWYVEGAHSFQRKGGHYVLITGVYESLASPRHLFLDILDPLDHEAPVTLSSTDRRLHYVMDLRPLAKAEQAFPVQDPHQQFPERLAGAAFFQPFPTPGKKEAVMPFLEGIMVLEAH
jgi:hypothetical protein